MYFKLVADSVLAAISLKADKKWFISCDNWAFLLARYHSLVLTFENAQSTHIRLDNLFIYPNSQHSQVNPIALTVWINVSV